MMDILSYYSWLFDLVGSPGKQYSKVLEVLNDMPFYEVVPNDSNRVVDGLNLRTKYREEESKPTFHSVRQCSVLEMMIGLSYRMNTSFYEPNQDRTQHWFWYMFNNLGLSDFPNGAGGTGLSGMATNRVEMIVQSMVDRNYGVDGRGGLFPLDGSAEDQTKVEIWMQMQAWAMSKV